jgi:hypothetical protein
VKKQRDSKKLNLQIERIRDLTNVVGGALEIYTGASDGAGGSGPSVTKNVSISIISIRPGG